MPSRWWIPVHNVRPEFVRLEHLHAGVSRWFDRTEADHNARTKPYALSPMGDSREGDGAAGFEVSVLTGQAFERLKEAGRAGGRLRVGTQFGRLGRAVLLSHVTWADLAVPSGRRGWELEFLTPTTFRSGNRSSPLPAAPSVLRGVSESWATCSGLPPRSLTHQQLDTIWVSDVSGRSEPMELSSLRVSGFVGRIRYQCDDPSVASIVDPLFRLAEYCGVGSAKAKGLGVTRLHQTRQPAGSVARAG